MKTLTTVLAVALTATVVLATPNTAKCAACHGIDWSKKALGKSKVVADMNATDIVTALKGYKAGTYGAAMKGVMKGQVAGYNDEELEAIAAEISETVKK